MKGFSQVACQKDEKKSKIRIHFGTPHPRPHQLGKSLPKT